MNSDVARVPAVPRHDITDPELVSLLEFADEHSTPAPIWYQTIAHNPSAAVASGLAWRAVFNEGVVPHTTKELVRKLVVQLHGCEFCMSQSSLDVPASEVEGMTCELPGSDHHDPKVQAALKWAESIYTSRDEAKLDMVFDELKSHYDNAEVVELCLLLRSCIGGAFIAHAMGMSRALKPSD